MRQYKTIKTLNNAIDKWFFNEILIKKFNYKDDIDDEEKIKKFMKTKKISLSLEKNESKQTENYIIYHKNKRKYLIFINYKKLTLEEEE